jgi:flagellar hook assembly protein FlgD
VRIYIYNIHGELVRELNVGKQEGGYYITKEQSAYWDGRNSSGEKVASGVYFYRMEAGEFRSTRKMVIMK